METKFIKLEWSYKRAQNQRNGMTYGVWVKCDTPHQTNFVNVNNIVEIRPIEPDFFGNIVEGCQVYISQANGYWLYDNRNPEKLIADILQASPLLCIADSKLKNELESRGYFFNLWHTDDIKGRAIELDIELSEDQICNVVDYIVRHIDCNYGITWDTIDNAITSINS